MAWIEAHQSLADHPKLIMAGEILDVSEAQVIGHLMFLWWWALDRAQDGDLSQYSARLVERAARWDGKPGAFHAALVQVGFIDSDGTIHDWHDYAGRLIERRKSDAQRKQDMRKLSAGRPQDNRQTSVGQRTDGVRTQQNPTQQNPTNPTEQQQQPVAVKEPPVAEKSPVVVALEGIGIFSSSHQAILEANPTLTPEDVYAMGVYAKRTKVRNNGGMGPGAIVTALKAKEKAPADCYAAIPDPDSFQPFVLE